MPASDAPGYPIRYQQEWTMRDGSRVLIRPIRPDDEAALARFHACLSDSSVYTRYFQWMSLGRRTAHVRLQRQCTVDYHHEIALVAERPDAQTNHREIIAVGRLNDAPPEQAPGYLPEGRPESRFLRSLAS